mgnify:CR=1 FL=1
MYKEPRINNVLLCRRRLVLVDFTFVKFEHNIQQQNPNDNKPANNQHLLFQAANLDHPRRLDIEPAQLEIGKVLEHGKVIGSGEVTKKQKLFAEEVSRREVISQRLEDGANCVRVLRNRRVYVFFVCVVYDVEVLF